MRGGGAIMLGPLATFGKGITLYCADILILKQILQPTGYDIP